MDASRIFSFSADLKKLNGAKIYFGICHFFQKLLDPKVKNFWFFGVLFCSGKFLVRYRYVHYI